MREGLVISAGMPRAGSGWCFNLIHDLVVAGGGQDARIIRSRYHLQRYLTEVNCNISTLKLNRILPVMFPVLMGNKFAIKTHAGPSEVIRWLHRSGAIKLTYIFRDPRAALLSAYEYGQKTKERGRTNSFSHLTSLESAAQFIQFYVDIWQAWSYVKEVHLVRYEDLIIDYDSECERLAVHLELPAKNGEIQAVVDEYRPERGDLRRKGTHFSKGQIERYREVFSPDQLDKFSTMFEPALKLMGYSS